MGRVSPNKVEKTRIGCKQVTISLAANINPISVRYMKNKVSLVDDLGKVSPTFPAALFTVDARLARKIERLQTGIK